MARAQISVGLNCGKTEIDHSGRIRLSASLKKRNLGGVFMPSHQDLNWTLFVPVPEIPERTETEPDGGEEADLPRSCGGIQR